MGFELEVAGSKTRPILRLRIDREGAEPRHGVCLADCTRVSREVESFLDERPDLSERYVLEVSSPGMERPVRWHRHWVRFVGSDVHAKLAGLGRVRARIVAVPDADTVVLEPEGGPARPYKLADIRDARLAVD